MNNTISPEDQVTLINSLLVVACIAGFAILPVTGFIGLVILVSIVSLIGSLCNDTRRR